MYRGAKIPALRGGYLFADYCGGQLRAISVQGGKVAQERVLPVRAASITSFGEDADGELYVLSDSGDGAQGRPGLIARPRPGSTTRSC